LALLRGDRCLDISRLVANAMALTFPPWVYSK
jgi:hypothetical protein